MKYAYTIFYVEEVEKTLQFYETAFGFKRKFITEEKDYGELLSGETTISFASLKLASSNFKNGVSMLNSTESPIGIEMAFVSENIEADYKRAIDAGALEYEKIAEKSWGQKVGYVLDNNGFLIEICSPVKT